MTLSIRPTRSTDGTPAIDPARAEHERQVRQARIELARRQTNWTEIPETRLVRRGVVFEPGKAVIGYLPDHVPMTFTVTDDGDLRFLDLQPGTWSEIVERRARSDKLSSPAPGAGRTGVRRATM